MFNRFTLPKLFVGLLLLAQPTCAETVSEAVARGIRHHPEVEAYRFDRLSADAGVEASRGLRLPRVSFSAELGAEDARAGQGIKENATVSLTQTIYDGGEVASHLRRSRQELRAAEQRFEDALMTVGLQVLQSYIEVQRSRKSVELMRKNLQSLTRIQKLVRQRVNAGHANGAELNQTMARVEGAREQLVVAEQLVADASAEFQILTGSTPGRLEPVRMPLIPLPVSVESAIALAITRSPKILAVKYEALAAAAAAETAASALAPKIGLRLSASYDGDEAQSSTYTSSASAMLTLRYDLYDGGTRRARERQAKYRAEASKLDSLITLQDVELEVRRSWNAVAASQSRTVPLKRRAEAARKALALHSQRFTAGKTSLDTLLGLQDEAAASELAYLNEVSSGRFHVYRILAATGSFLPSLGLKFSSVDDLR